MGRRALRKIDPSLDLTNHLKTFDQLPRPWDASLLFGRQGAVGGRSWVGQGTFFAQCRRRNAGNEFPWHRNRREIRPVRRGHAGQTKFAQCRRGPSRCLAHFRRVAARRFASSGACLFSRSVVEKAAQKTPSDAGIVSPRHPAHAFTRRRSPFLDRCGRIFSFHAGTDCGLYQFAWPARCTRDAGRARHGLPNPFRTPHAPIERAGLPGGIPEKYCKYIFITLEDEQGSRVRCIARTRFARVYEF